MNDNIDLIDSLSSMLSRAGSGMSTSHPGAHKAGHRVKMREKPCRARNIGQFSTYWATVAKSRVLASYRRRANSAIFDAIHARRRGARVGGGMAASVRTLHIPCAPPSPLEFLYEFKIKKTTTKKTTTTCYPPIPVLPVTH